MLDNATVELSLVRWAQDILDQYELGNKGDARRNFNNVPEDRKAYVTYMMVTLAAAHHNSVSVGEVGTFIRSVTK